VVAGLSHDFDPSGGNEPLKRREHVRPFGAELLEQYPGHSHGESSAGPVDEPLENRGCRRITSIRDSIQYAAIGLLVEIRIAGPDIENAIASHAVGLVQLEIEADIHARSSLAAAGPT
jgi:hypothetical protein